MRLQKFAPRALLFIFLRSKLRLQTRYARTCAIFKRIFYLPAVCRTGNSLRVINMFCKCNRLVFFIKYILFIRTMSPIFKRADLFCIDINIKYSSVDALIYICHSFYRRVKKNQHNYKIRNSVQYIKRNPADPISQSVCRSIEKGFRYSEKGSKE